MPRGDLDDSRGLELLADLADHTADVLKQELGLNDEDAEIGAMAVVDRIRFAWGGSQPYIPEGASLDSIRLHREIWRLCTGSNCPQVAAELGITEAHVYRVYKGMRKKAMNDAHDGGLFPPGHS